MNREEVIEGAAAPRDRSRPRLPAHALQMENISDERVWLRTKYHDKHLRTSQEIHLNTFQLRTTPGVTISPSKIVCLGQCYSYSVPDTLPQTSESLLHCDSCTPSDTTWDVVTLQCGDDYSDGGGGDADDDGAEGSPEVTKLVEKILRCECQACGAQQHLLLAATAGGGGEAHGADPLLASMAGSAAQPEPEEEEESAGAAAAVAGPRRGLSHDPEPGAAHGDDSEAGPRQPAREGERSEPPAFPAEAERRHRAAASVGGAGGAGDSSGREWEHPHNKRHGQHHARGHHRHGGGGGAAENPDRLAAGLWGGENYRGGL
ncbi:unnamed protein product [Lampetra fluviatilis]